MKTNTEESIVEEEIEMPRNQGNLAARNSMNGLERENSSINRINEENEQILDEEDEKSKQKMTQVEKSLKKKMVFMLQVLGVLTSCIVFHFLHVQWAVLLIFCFLLGCQLAWRVFKNRKNLSMRKVYLLSKMMETCLILTTSVMKFEDNKIRFGFI
jgi:uncharacterized membrane protein YbjE (DUF340 family)